MILLSATEAENKANVAILVFNITSSKETLRFSIIRKDKTFIELNLSSREINGCVIDET